MLPEAIDVAMLAASLGVCRADITVLGNRPPRAVCQRYTADDRQIIRLHAQFALRARFELPEDWYLFGYLHRSGGNSWCHAVPVQDDDAFLVLPGNDADLLLRPGGRLSVLLIPARRVPDRTSQMDLAEAHPGLARMFHCAGGSELEPLRLRYQRLWRSPSGRGAIERIDDIVRCHLDAAIQWRSAEVRHCSTSRLRRYAILRRAVHFMEVHLAEDLYLDTISQAVGTSERTLRHAFEDLVGLPPMRYLQRLRLSRACRTLAEADASRRSVKSVAITCGLRDLSRFALSYRRIFGEPPHVTLSRSSATQAMSF